MIGEQSPGMTVIFMKPPPRIRNDRVGGGDSFANGLIHGFLKYNDPQLAVEYGATRALA